MHLKLLVGNLYKINLVSVNQPNDRESDNPEKWAPFIKAMDDDYNKNVEFKFSHPDDANTPYYRQYVYSPSNGNTFMMVGQLRRPTDSACARVVINSENYKYSYLAIYDYLRCFSDPDVMAEMMVHSFNGALQKAGVKMVYEPWDTKGEDVRWLDDCELTYNKNFLMTEGKNVSKMGYEDVREHQKKMIARNEKRKMAKIAMNGPKKEKIEDFIVKDKHQETIMRFLRNSLKNRWESKEVSKPFRLLYDLNYTEFIPFSIVMEAMPELNGRVSRSRYNHWTNKVLSSYKDDEDYNELRKELDEML